MDKISILETAALAIDALTIGEPEIFAVDVNERSVSARLAIHLQHHFPDWHVDCEYNRLGEDIKRLPRAEETRTDETEGRTIYPDIIVHRRGKAANLLVIEVKKDGNDDTVRDVEKLKGLTYPDGGYAYRCGLHLTFDCARSIVSDAIVYVAGDVDERLTLWLKFRLGHPSVRQVLEEVTAEFHRQYKSESQ